MIAIGQTLGNYRIVDKLGAGGMGVVWLAEHPLIGKRVALKVIHGELAQNRDVVTRFFNEARAVNQIGNEHIVDISDFGQTAEGELFFIMELLAGLSLGDVIEREHVLPVARALHIAQQIADALGATHAAGVIHRDLKPDNVFLVTKHSDPDFVKILDFGLAKLLDGGGPQANTQKGVILGTPEFMSPEQCESKGGVDHRSDIYALGVLMYQMLTSQLPFTGATMGEVLVKQVAHPVPLPRLLNPAIPVAVEQVILRCLAKKADHRFQHMAEVRAALLDPPAAAANAPTLLDMDVSVSGKFPVISGAPPPPVFAAAAPPGSLRWLWITLAVLAVGGAAAIVLVRKSDEAQLASVTPAAAPAAPPPLAVPAPSPADAAPPSVQQLPSEVRIHITTEPSGAEVYDEASGERLGVSPTELHLPRNNGDHVLLFRHPTCVEKRRAIKTNADAELEIILDPSKDSTVTTKPLRKRPPRRGKWKPENDGILKPTF